MTEESIRCSRCGGQYAHCACSLALRQTYTPTAPVNRETADAVLWRGLCKAVETLTRERDEAITKWARAAEEAHDATARADAFNVALHTALCGECLAFPGCGEACHTATCDCCHDDATTDDLIADVAKLKARADRLQATLDGLVE